MQLTLRAPRSLLWRTFVLMAALMLLSLAAWFAIFSSYEREPRARQLAQTLISVANLTRVTLLSAREDKRLAVLRELDAREGIHIYLSDATDKVVGVSGDAFLELVQSQVRQTLGDRTRLGLELNGKTGLFLSFQLEENDDDEYWVALPRERIEHRFGLNWIGWGLAVMVLSLGGAWAIVLSIARPLQRISQAARKVGAGETAQVLPDEGPDEIAAVSRAFNQMSTDLAQLDQDRALVLAGISHDLRTPLTRLRMGIELTDDPAMRDGMSADVDEMDKTISQFLDFARAESGEALEAIDPVTLLADIAAAYQRRRAPIMLHANSAARLQARPQALRRAISNLVDNAMRYAPGSPIDLMLETRGKELVFSVLDRGPGIPPHEVARLKRPFTRLNDARSNTAGAGLGLAIIERVMRAHGGRFVLEPREGGGLAARLAFPISPGPRWPVRDAARDHGDSGPSGAHR